MRSAFALRINSGKNILYFVIPERLRTLRYDIFTGGVVAANGSCSAAFSESAVLRGKYPFRLLPLVAATFPKGTAFGGNGKVSGIEQRRPLGGAGKTVRF